ncbi:unnamed protein product, partial [Ilex paraguariensis]
MSYRKEARLKAGANSIPILFQRRCHIPRRVRKTWLTRQRKELSEGKESEGSAKDRGS